jgi:hypothetical protein
MMCFGAFQNSGFQNNAFQMRAYPERPAGGTTKVDWWPERPKYAEDRIKELPDVAQQVIAKAAEKPTQSARESVIRKELQGVEDRFIRVYLALLERMLQDQAAHEAHIAYELEKARMEAIRQDDLAAAYLLLL